MPGDTCDDALPFDGSTTWASRDGYADDYSFSECPGSPDSPSGPDIVHSFTPTETGQYRLSVTEDASLGVVYVTTDCEDMASACQRVVVQADGGMPVGLEAGVTYYFIVGGVAFPCPPIEVDPDCNPIAFSLELTLSCPATACIAGSCPSNPGAECLDDLCCLTPTCDDGVADGDETDVDCGGSACPSCTQGQACLSDPDCESANCEDGLCMAPAEAGG